MTELEWLLIDDTRVTTLKPIMQLPKLKALSMYRLSIPEEEIDEFIRLHPDCKIYGIDTESN